MESTVTGAGTEAEITTRTFDPTYAAVSPPRCAWVRSDLGREALLDCSRFYSNNLHQDKLHRLLQLRGREYPMSWTHMNARAVERMSKRQSWQSALPREPCLLCRYGRTPGSRSSQHARPNTENLESLQPTTATIVRVLCSFAEARPHFGTREAEAEGGVQLRGATLECIPNQVFWRSERLFRRRRIALRWNRFPHLDLFMHLTQLIAVFAIWVRAICRFN